MSHFKKYPGIILGLITILIHLISWAGAKDQFFIVYSTFCFPAIRIIYDYTLGMLPVAMIYILLVVFLYWIAIKIMGTIRNPSAWRNSTFWWENGMKIFSFCGIVFSTFYWLWAFNYYQKDIDQRLNLPTVKVDTLTLSEEFFEITHLLSQERQKITNDTFAIHQEISWTRLENKLRELQTTLLLSWGIKPYGRVRVRQLFPKGVLLRISTAGVYIPFVCEGHVDAGMHPIQWPFTAAHEMAHGYGFTDEGECNFIALLTCMSSDDAFIRYSALLSYWKYLFSDIKKQNSSFVKSTYKKLDSGIKADIEAINAEMEKYSDILPVLRDVVYDQYLKTHGVRNGLMSYHDITTRVIRWKKSRYYIPFTINQ